MAKISFKEHAKQILRAVGDIAGVQFANRNHLGVNFWHDFRRLNLRNHYFLDVGANIGQWAADARTHYPNVSILSLEPEPNAFEKLCQGFHNDCRHHAVQLAASDRSGTAELRLGRGRMGTTHSLEPRWAPLLSGDNNSVVIQTDTIDSIAQRLDLKHITLLKIDVEGHELQCIKGAKRMLQERRVDSILVEVGFLDGIHTPLHKVERLLAEDGQRFLALYGLAPNPSGYANAFFANALFCHHELRLD
jgi:FkbM family methyltransferase